jgi:hypothetical protein
LNGSEKQNVSQRIQAKVKKRRGFTYLWIFGLALLVFLLIYFEQTALLYIFSTLGVTVLLVIVALADLGQSEASGSEPDAAQPLSSRNPAR